jgi:hypothetical protein
LIDIVGPERLKEWAKAAPKTSERMAAVDRFPYRDRFIAADWLLFPQPFH